MEQFSLNNVKKTERTARLVVTLGRAGTCCCFFSSSRMRSEAHTPSGAVDTWRSNVGAKAAEVFSLYCESHYCEELCSLA